MLLRLLLLNIQAISKKRTDRTMVKNIPDHKLKGKCRIQFFCSNDNKFIQFHITIRKPLNRLYRVEAFKSFCIEFLHS